MNDATSSIDETQVRMRAFELWQARGCPMGSPEDDWFSAKISLEAEIGAAPPESGTLRLGLCIAPEESPAPPSSTRTKVVAVPAVKAASRKPNAKQGRRAAGR